MAAADQPVTLALIGGGPRAVGVLERLSASANLLQSAQLEVHLFDPHMPAAGRIWRADESEHLLMNSRAQDVTIFTDSSFTGEGPVVAGPSLAQWAEHVRTGQIPAPTASTSRLAEIETLTPSTFPTRRLQALYLEWFFGQLRRNLPGELSLHIHRQAVSDLRPLTGTDGAADGAAGWELTLADGRLLRTDLAVLSLGHTDAQLSPAQHALAEAATAFGGTYQPPAQAADTQLDRIPAGADVLVRGLGLGFLDVMSLLTEGRGGTFEPAPSESDPGALRYVPTGAEPVLHVGSRRGVPYHAKVRDEGIPAGPQDLAHLTAENLAARENSEGLLRLEEDLAPLIVDEIARAVPTAPIPPADPAVPARERLTWLDRPLRHLQGAAEPAPAGAAPYEPAAHDVVMRHIRQDLEARQGADPSAARALFQVLLRIHGALSVHVPATRLVPEDRAAYSRWWPSLFSFVCSGPPPHRLRQLIALEEAGLLRFLGPIAALRITDQGFEAGGVRTVHLIDAYLHPPALAESTSPLIRAIADRLGAEASEVPGTLRVTADMRVPRPSPSADASVWHGLWAQGPWTSEFPVPPFARPQTNNPGFRRNDAVARDILRAAAARPPQQRAADHTPALLRAPGADPSRHARQGAERPPRADGPHSAADRREHAEQERPLRLGIIGAGRFGTALARRAARRGLPVAVVSSREARDLHERLPAAVVLSLEEVARTADVVVLATPLAAALELDPELLDGVTLVDATNAWGEEDARALARAPGAASTSEAIARRFPRSHVVKSLNHVGYHDMEEPAGQRAVAVAAEPGPGADRAARLIEQLGFEPVMLPALAEGVHLEPRGVAFGGWRTRGELTQLLTLL